MNKFTKYSLAVSGLLAASMPVSAMRPPHAAPLFRPGEVIVRYRDQAPATSIDAMKSRLALKRIGGTLGGRFERLELPSAMDVAGAIRTLASDPTVESVQPNYVKRRFQAATVPNDPDFSLQWGLDNTGQANFVSGGPAGLVGADMDLLAAWDPSGNGSFPQTGNRSVTVAVLDNGFQTDHPDFIHPDNTSNFIAGMNFTANPANSDVTPDSSSSDSAHGTEVAGCLGAVGNNGSGVAGAIWNVKMMPLKFGFDTASEIAALLYAASNGAQIVNASFGGPTYDPAELAELQDLNNRGILFVTSAGNENSNTDFAGASYPANYDLPNVLAVAATNRQDGIASYSTFGPTTVPLAAPGLQLITTETNSGYSASPGVYGTSFSAPLAAGVAALIKSYNASADDTELKSRLIEGASAGVDTTNPVNLLVAGGRVDAAQSMGLAGTGPSLVIQPVSVSSYLANNPDSGAGSITVPVTAPVRIVGAHSIDTPENSCYADPNGASAGNCVVIPGDSADLQITVQNLWNDATTVAGTLTASNGVSVIGGSTSFGDIPHLGTATGTFQITVPGNLQGHQYLNFTLALTAAGGYSAERHFMLEVGRLFNNVTASQAIGTNLYDNYHTWTFTLGALPPGQDTLSFEASAANDVDIIVSYQSPPQYLIDANGYSDPGAYYYYNVPDAQTGAGFGPGYTEYVNIPNPLPGVYYVTVVNYDQANSAYQLVAFTNTGGVGAALSSTVEAQQAASDSGGGGAFDPALLGLFAGLPLIRRMRRRRA